MNDLPPRPDPETGEPAPPDAPITTREKNPPSAGELHSPPPPDGYGRMLQKYIQPKGMASGTGWAGFAIIAGGFSLLTWRISWIWDGPYYVHAAALLMALFAFLSTKNTNVYAGSDWLRYGRKWVDLYKLKTIKVSSGPYGAKNLILEDTLGNIVSAPVATLCANQKLWNLVYNGMRYAIANGVHPKGMLVQNVLQFPEQNPSD